MQDDEVGDDERGREGKGGKGETSLSEAGLLLEVSVPEVVAVAGVDDCSCVLAKTREIDGQEEGKSTVKAKRVIRRR